MCTCGGDADVVAVPTYLDATRRQPAGRIYVAVECDVITDDDSAARTWPEYQL